MTLLEIATIAATKLRRQNEPDVIEVAKTLIQNRYKSVYADGLWRDSLFSLPINFAVTGTPDLYNETALNSAGFYLFPTVVERVVALRTTDQSLSVQSGEQMMRVDPDLFSQTGRPLAFEILSPVVAMIYNDYTVPLGVMSASATDASLTTKVVGLNIRNERFSVEVSLSTTPQPVSSTWMEVERWSKPVTSGDCSLVNRFNSYPYATMEASETGAIPKCRIRLIPKPTEDTAARALIKKRMMAFEDDNDVPELRGVDMCLVEFGYAELLRYYRRGDEALAADQIGAAMLLSLKQANTMVEACNQRIIPEPVAAVDLWPRPFGKSDF